MRKGVGRFVVAFAYALSMGACLENPAVTCKNGLICAPGNVCDDAHGGCATSSQIVACTGQAAEAVCSYPGVTDGACYDGVCLPAGCGNGVMAVDEACDDGNRIHGDGCSADCRSIETCGNAIIDEITLEQCDDGNLTDGDGCQSTCRAPRCGDGIKDVADNEECDDGPNNSNTVPDACRSNCQAHFCGDGVPDGDEVCDDGNNVAGDGCFYACQSNETCGNGYVDVGRSESCDDGDHQSHDGCGACRPELAVWTTGKTGPPIGRFGHAMAYDAARGRVVLFGGFGDTTIPSDTWEWDGNTWMNVTPKLGNPRPREASALAYDAARARVVLFGGNSGSSALADTWEWDGSAWTEVTPLTGNPPARSQHALAYDAARERIVLFGGSEWGPTLNDTWEWDGSAWTNMTPAGTSPAVRIEFGLAYDAGRGRVVLHGGANPDGTQYNDTWEWNGSVWADVSPASGRPPLRSAHSLAYDAARNRVVMFGGSSSTGGRFNEIWEWSGTAWANVTPASGSPTARAFSAVAYDFARRRLVMFSGMDATGLTLPDTREWNGSAWSVPAAVTSPSVRLLPAVAYDAARGRVVLFGGVSNGVYFNDTWEWNGSVWTNVTPATGNPSARYGHALTYDAVRKRIVMFGGHTGAGITLNDTWEWNGTAWANVTPSSGNPPVRYAHALAYDVARGRVVLFSGFDDDTTVPNDTWEWNGTTWTNVTPASGNPSVRS